MPGWACAVVVLLAIVGAIPVVCFDRWGNFRWFK